MTPTKASYDHILYTLLRVTKWYNEGQGNDQTEKKCVRGGAAWYPTQHRCKSAWAQFVHASMMPWRSSTTNSGWIRYDHFCIMPALTHLGFTPRAPRDNDVLTSLLQLREATTESITDHHIHNACICTHSIRAYLRKRGSPLPIRLGLSKNDFRVNFTFHCASTRTIRTHACVSLRDCWVGDERWSSGSAKFPHQWLPQSGSSSSGGLKRASTASDDQLSTQ